MLMLYGHQSHAHTRKNRQLRQMKQRGCNGAMERHRMVFGCHICFFPTPGIVSRARFFWGGFCDDTSIKNSISMASSAIECALCCVCVASSWDILPRTFSIEWYANVWWLEKSSCTINNFAELFRVHFRNIDM